MNGNDGAALQLALFALHALETVILAFGLWIVSDLRDRIARLENRAIAPEGKVK